MLTATTNTVKRQFNSPNYSTAVIDLGFDSSRPGFSIGTLTTQAYNAITLAALVDVNDIFYMPDPQRALANRPARVLTRSSRPGDAIRLIAMF